MKSRLAYTLTMKMKLLIYLALLSSVPVALMGLFSASYSSGTIAEITFQNNASILRNLEKEMNGEFKKIDNLMLQYSYQNSNFYQLVKSDLSYTNYAVVWDLNNILTNLRSGLEHVAEIDFYNITYGKVLTSSGGIYTEEDFLDPIVLQNARNAVNGTWVNTRANINPRLSGNHLAYTRPIQNKQTSRIEGAIIVYLDAASISRSMLTVKDTQTEYFVLDSKGNILMDSRLDRIGQRMEEPQFLQKLIPSDDSEEFEFQFKLNGTQSLVNVQHSSYRNWSYVSTVPLELLTKPSDQLRNILLSISLSLIVLALVLAVAISKSLYSPIQRLTKKIFTHKSWEDKNEFRMITRYIESVEHDNESLQKSIQKTMEEVKNYSFFQLLLGNVKDSHYLSELDFGEGDIVLFLVELDQLQLEQQFSRNDQFLYYFAVQNITEEILRTEGLVKIIMIRPGMFAVIHEFHGNHEASAIRERANRILEAIRTYLKLPCVIAASHSARGLNGLNDAYSEGMKALRYSFIYGHNQVILSNEWDPSFSAEAEELDEYEMNMISALLTDDIDASEGQFEQLIELIRDNYSLSPEEMFGYFASLAGRLWNAIDKHYKHVLDESSVKDWILILAKQRTLQEVESFIRAEFFERIRESNRGGKAANEQLLIGNVTEYIQSHYDEDLSLQLCADLVHLNTFQLSRMFKKVMGVNFVDYVINYRVEIAKKMLANPELKVLDISDKLRYSSVKSFIRLFKKETGVTPGIYRKQLLQGQE